MDGTAGGPGPPAGASLCALRELLERDRAAGAERDPEHGVGGRGGDDERLKEFRRSERGVSFGVRSANQVRQGDQHDRCRLPWPASGETEQCDSSRRERHRDEPPSLAVLQGSHFGTGQLRGEAERRQREERSVAAQSPTGCPVASRRRSETRTPPRAAARIQFPFRRWRRRSRTCVRVRPPATRRHARGCCRRHAHGSWRRARRPRRSPPPGESARPEAAGRRSTGCRQPVRPSRPRTRCA